MILAILIIIGLVISLIVRSVNRLAGAVVGLFLVIGVLFYGLDLYRTEGWEMTFFGIPISKPVFLIIIGVWSLFVIIDLISAAIKKR